MSYNADRLVMHDMDSGAAYVRVQDEEGRFHATHVLSDERRAAAQALAGHDYRVIPVTADDRPASEREIEQARADEAATMQEDLHSILHALGLSTAARAASPHEVVEHEIVPAIWRLRQKDPAYTDEDWREQIGRVLSLLGIEDGVIRRPPVDIIDTIRGKIDNLYSLSRRLDQERDDLRKRLHEAEVQTAHPDRPEPVDPWDVATGDLVDYERLPSFKTCRVVGEVQETFSDQNTSRSLRIHGAWWNANPDVATVRVLHRPEPEPDPGVVQALIAAMEAADRSLGEREQEDWGALARALIRDHGVNVEVSE